MNFGIIGYGKLGRLRHQVLEKMGAHSVLQVCDPTPVQGDFRYVADPEPLWANPEVETVFVCTPNRFTKEYVIRSLDAGKHVFAEKPPGVSSQEVLEMMDAEKRNPGLKLMFGFNHRYHPSVVEARKRIATGEFGRILWMRGRYGKSVDKTFFDSWRASKEQAGGGILLDQGIHMLDLLMLFADGFDEVKSFCSNLYWNLEVEDNVFALLKNNTNRIVASLHSTMTQWRHLFSLEIFLERGYMVINGLITSSMAYTTNWGKEVLSIAMNRTPPPQARHAQEERFVYDEDGSWFAEMEDFFEVVQTDTPVRNGSTQDSLKLMEMIEHIYQDGGF
jgi:1,5-anhydro-D-fructose reductase (1,5-anhydro-D-mannitol-forming)